MVSLILSLILLVVGVLIPAGGPQARGLLAAADRTAAQQERLKAYGSLPMSFEANRGQTNRSVQFLAHAEGYTLFLKPGSAVLALEKPVAPVANPRAPGAQKVREQVLRMKFVGARSSAPAAGLDKLAGVSNYFLGNDPRAWRTGIPNYRKVKYRNLYPGTDLVYYGAQGRLEFDFDLAPAADPARIHLAFEGGKPTLDPKGNLRIALNGGGVTLPKPRAYQQVSAPGSSRRQVGIEYVLEGKNEVGFRVTGYDASQRLIIDPVLDYGTFLGGTQGETALGIALDASAEAYITGVTASSNYPTASAYQSSERGGTDAFITKLSSDGTALIYSTYLGGSGDDRANGIALDGNGYAYVVGTTSSTDFPTTNSTAPVFQPSLAGSSDAFVAKLDPTGTTLTYSSYLGGSDADYGFAIAVGPQGSAYVTGSTSSGDFPIAFAFQGGNGGNSDAFVAKVSPDASTLTYSTYLGGSAADAGQGIAVDSAGDVYVTGYTYSSNFPVLNAEQPANAGSSDAFITKLDPNGTALVYSTYLGGTGLDRGNAIAIDASGDVFVAGDTQSSGFPVSATAAQRNYNGNQDAFVAELNGTGATLNYATYLGGTGLDQSTAIAVDTSGNAYVGGFTRSSDFPRSSPIQATFGGGTCGSQACTEGFVTELNPQGSGLLYSTYLGGSGADYVQAIAVDTASPPNAYVAGGTASTNFPAVAGAYQGSPGDTSGNGDAFVVKLDPASEAGVGLSPQKLDFGSQALQTQSAIQTVALTNVGTVPLTITGITTNSTDFNQVNNCIGTVPPSGGTCTISVSFTPTSLQTETQLLTITDNAPSTTQQVTLTGTGVPPTTTVTLNPTSLTFPSQSINTASSPQTVTLTNTGTTALTITDITASGDFAETNNCPSSTSLPSGSLCSIFVTFTPTASGIRGGALVITDNATTGSQSVALSGTGIAGFSLTTAKPSQTLTIGTTSTTFTISAVGPSTITGNITLACAAGPTCSFNPATVTVGQDSTLTVSGLSTTSANPTNLTVTGTNGSQTADLSLTLFFADYALTSTPPLDTISAGDSATYTITVTPSNHFNQAVLLGCATASGSGFPAASTCTFTPSAVLMDGTGASASVTLKLNTTQRSSLLAPWWARRWGPLGGLPALVWGILGVLFLLLFLGAKFAPPVRRRIPRWIPARALTFLLALVLLTAMATSACNTTYVYDYIHPANTTGTPAGNYVVTITGTLGGGQSPVVRTTTVNLAVN